MKSKILVLLVLGLGIVAVGCSGGDDGPTQKTTTLAEAKAQTAAKPGFNLHKPNAASAGGAGGAAQATAATE